MGNGQVDSFKKTVLDKLYFSELEFDKDWLENLPEALAMMIECAGLDSALRIWSFLEGQHHYFPTLNRAMAPLIEKEIRENPEGLSPRELAAKYGYSKNHIYRILNRPDKRGRSKAA